MNIDKLILFIFALLILTGVRDTIFGKVFFIIVLMISIFSLFFDIYLLMNKSRFIDSANKYIAKRLEHLTSFITKDIKHKKLNYILKANFGIFALSALMFISWIFIIEKEISVFMVLWLLILMAISGFMALLIIIYNTNTNVLERLKFITFIVERNLEKSEDSLYIEGIIKFSFVILFLIVYLMTDLIILF